MEFLLFEQDLNMNKSYWWTGTTDTSTKRKYLQHMKIGKSTDI